MTYLVKKHETGEYCISDDDPSLLKQCEESGDKVILSWEKGKKGSAFISYFSKVKHDAQTIIEGCREKQIDKESMVDIVRDTYNEDRNIITNLFEQNIISHGELRRLTKLNRQAEIKQLVIVRDCFRFHSIVKTTNYRHKLLLKKTK